MDDNSHNWPLLLLSVHDNSRELLINQLPLQEHWSARPPTALLPPLLPTNSPPAAWQPVDLTELNREILAHQHDIARLLAWASALPNATDKPMTQFTPSPTLDDSPPHGTLHTVKKEIELTTHHAPSETNPSTNCEPQQILSNISNISVALAMASAQWCNTQQQFTTTLPTSQPSASRPLGPTTRNQTTPTQTWQCAPMLDKNQPSWQWQIN